MSLWYERCLLIAFFVVAVNGVLRGKAGEIVLPVTLCGLAAILWILVSRMQTASSNIGVILRSTGLEKDMFLPLIKALTITELTTVSAELCRDNGEKSIAAVLELCGAAAALWCVLPLAEEALRLIGSVGG